MSKVIIYTKKGCTYCVNAKSLLKEKDVDYLEIDVTDNQELIKEAIEKSGGKKTVPQIFIDGKSLGGFSDLDALDKSGELNKLLQKSSDEI